MERSGVEPGGSMFERWWNAGGEWVEPPNRRRGGESGVQRLREGGTVFYAKRQRGHLHRSLLHPLGRPTVLREQEALEAFSGIGVRVPRVVYCGARKDAEGWRAMLVSEALDGFLSLDAWYAGGGRARWGEAAHGLMLRQLALTLARLHASGWQHGCCYPKHIFVKASGAPALPRVEVALLDLEKSRRRWRASAASHHDLGQLARHRAGMPEEDWQRFIALYRGFSAAE